MIGRTVAAASTIADSGDMREVPAERGHAASASLVDALWESRSIIWLVIAGEALAAVLALAPESSGNRWVYFGLASLAAQWIGLIALGGLYLLRRHLSRMAPSRIAWVALGMLLASAVLTMLAASWLLSGLLAANSAHDASRLLVSIACIAAIVGILGLAAFQNYSNARLHLLTAKQAQVDALQARVNPHFLFNTLNSATALLRSRPDDAERVLVDLADLFRAALSEAGWISLSAELDLARRYLAIEQLRFGERLELDWQSPPSSDGWSVPLLSIQPLVENAVLHGGRDSQGKQRISVRVDETPRELVVTVHNSTSTDALESTRVRGHGVGLRALRARLEALAGNAARLETMQAEGEFEAVLRIPRSAMPALPASTDWSQVTTS